MEKNKSNVNNFAIELSELIGQHIDMVHIHLSKKGRNYQIQAPKSGAPMLLHHYNGYFFIDIHPDDFEDISSGKISAYKYITSANWQVGYYWGGTFMTGGYYQPLDLVGRRDEVRRYLQILSCRGYRQSCGYRPSELNCADCSVENCPYNEGNWDAEIQEHDPRIDLFKALTERFEQENPGYTLCGFRCGGIPDVEIWIDPNGRSTENERFSFTAYASDSVIRSLLMHEIEPENWTEYVKKFRFRNQKVFIGMDNTMKANTGHDDDIYEGKKPLLTCLANFFKKMF